MTLPAPPRNLAATKRDSSEKAPSKLVERQAAGANTRDDSGLSAFQFANRDRRTAPRAGTAGVINTQSTSDELIQLKRQWVRIKGRMRTEVGETVYNNWLCDLRVMGWEAGTVQICASNQKLSKFIAQRYQQRISRLWVLEDPTITNVVIISKESLAQNTKAGDDTDLSTSDMQSAQSTIAQDIDEYDLGTRPGAQFQLANFVVGDAQQLAAAAARNIINNQKATYNPVYINGPVGYGKTHLLQAIANEINLSSSDKRKVKYLSAQKFLHSFVTQSRQGDTSQLKNWFSQVDVLLLDDVHHLAGKTKTQEELYFLLSEMLGQNRQLVVTGSCMPLELEKIEERLRSRLGGGLVTTLSALDFDTRLKITSQMADDRSIELSGDVIQYVARRIKGSPRDLSGALNRLSAHLNLLETKVTVEFCDKILSDLIAKSPRQITVERIQRVVSEYFSITQSDMLSKCRNRNLVRPRQVAMYYTKRLTSRSLPDIGRRFGDRDHTTVMHALRKVEDLQKRDVQFKEQLHDISRLFDNSGL